MIIYSKPWFVVHHRVFMLDLLVNNRTTNIKILWYQLTIRLINFILLEIFVCCI